MTPVRAPAAPARPTAPTSAGSAFPHDVDPAAIRPEDLPADGYGDLAEIDDFERLVADVAAGRMSDDDFRPRRLHFGVYGIRGSTDTHMIRVKTPLGRFTATQFEAMAVIADRYAPPRVGHVTTRQCFQFHRIPRARVGDVLRLVALAGLTTREACGNAVRNVTLSPLAGVHPDEVLDVEAAADEVVRALLRHPAYQALPRKFKIAFSATDDDDAGTGFHDVGVLPATGPQGEPGYRIVLGGGLGSSPREAVAVEPFTPAAWLLPTILAALDLFEAEGERRNRVRARMKFLVHKLGIDEFVARVVAIREQLLADGVHSQVTPHPPVAVGDLVAAPVSLPAPLAHRDASRYAHWVDGNTVRQRQGDRFAVYASLALGDLTPEQFRGLATLMRTHGLEDARLTIRQNVVLRDVPPRVLPALWAGLADLGLDRPFAEKSGDIVSCPGAETCNLAITASRGLGAAIQDRLAADGLDEVQDVSLNISGCPNSCGQHQAWDIGFSGMARHDEAGNEAPAYRVWVGAHVTDGGARFGEYVTNVPARHAPTVAARLLAQYRGERRPDETMWQWYDRIGGKREVARRLVDLKPIPPRSEDPAYYADFGEAEPFAVAIGQGECMA